MPSSPSAELHAGAWSPDEDPIAPGVILAGRYELVAPIGEGGMGVVWRARQLTTDKPVAVKLLRSEDDADVARFLREAKLAAGLAHPNIVQVFDFWETPPDARGRSFVFMVMELLEGESLGSYLRAVGRLSYDETIDLMLPVARALRFSHAKGVVHRDLKPDNVFLTRTPDAPTPSDVAVASIVKVVDFGLAKPLSAAIEQTAMTQPGSVLGTPLYMAPEMVYGERVDVSADLWAIGVMMYECIVGAAPFLGDNFGQIFRRIAHGSCVPLGEAAPHVPPAFSALVMRLLSHDTADRPTAGDLTDWLEREATVGARPARQARVETRSSRRSPVVGQTQRLPSPAGSARSPLAVDRSAIRAAALVPDEVAGAAPARFSALAVASGFFVALIVTASIVLVGRRKPATEVLERPEASIGAPATPMSASAPPMTSPSTPASAIAPASREAALAPAPSRDPTEGSAATPSTTASSPRATAPAITANTARPPRHPRPAPVPKKSPEPVDPLTGGRF